MVHDAEVTERRPIDVTLFGIGDGKSVPSDINSLLNRDSASISQLLSWGTMMPATILIIDDDVDLRNSLAAVLRPMFKVLEASGGAQAIDVIENERPRLALLDVSMPGMNGLEVLTAAKALDPALIVVMLTSHQDIEIAAKALNLGATEYVTKPFDADYIRAEIFRLASPGEPLNDRPWRMVP